VIASGSRRESLRDLEALVLLTPFRPLPERIRYDTPIMTIDP
jgi:hypothetical protein